MGNSYGNRAEETRRIGLRIFAMTACAAAFAAGILLPSSQDEQLARSTPEPTRVAKAHIAFSE